MKVTSFVAYATCESCRAAETTRAEHAAALGFATARIRELEATVELEQLLRKGEGEYERLGARNVMAKLEASLARIREMEGERDRALDALRVEERKTYAAMRETHAARLERDELLDFAKSVASMNYPSHGLPWWTREARAVVARIEKATKGTT